ncbi:methylenetetrahydrofolate reductase [Marinobacter caseinilyticus]|uniref:methylenetetrahydrofolate reductase n=1 Tax=Marinobacter caseinilyticus TaxID=2692195 RepID=UPI00140916F4|nr:methylenetetrahydrofolate reductase [Marinobacter caseinilyticus]
MKLAHESSASSSQDTVQMAAVLRELARTASIEAAPLQILGMEALSDWLPAGTAVYIPFLPNARFEDTVSACWRLRAAGMVPIPHFPARAIASRAQARDWLGELAAASTDRLMLIAGDSHQVAGPFPDTLAVLNSGLLADYAFCHLGIAGHPDGHPVASSEELTRAMAIKREYATATATRMWVVTQFAFEADTFIHWLQSMKEVVDPLPVYFGIAGPTRLRMLIAYAARCGVGVSARMMRRNPDASRLLRAWTPDRLVAAMARHRADNPTSLFQGIHVFPFGGLQRSSEWLRGLRDKPIYGADTVSQTQV